VNLRSTSIARLAVFAMLWHSALAETVDSDPSPPIFSFSGFGTAGEVHSSQDQADFTGSVFQPNGAGYTRRWSPEVDSLLGAQLTANIAPKLSAVLQVIAEQNYNGTFTPHVEWANLKYQFTPDFSVRIGRVELPTFLFSDTRKVGYTYPWVRPPIEVYTLLPITASDGAGLSYRLSANDFTNTTQGSEVQNSTPLPGNGSRAMGRDSFNFSNTSEYKSLTFRVSYQHARLSIKSLDGFLDNFRMFGPQGIAIADKYDSDDKPVETEVIGASYDPGHWFVISEWGHARFNSFLGELTGWYVSGGYRAGQFTPYVTYAHVSAASHSDPGLTLTALPPALAGFASGLNAALNSILQASIPDQSTVSLGARWDCAKNIDLKAQFDHTRISADSDGTLINIQPGFRPGSTVNLFSATVDFVF
jgi:hypothetical protein